MTRSFKVCESLSGAAPAGWVASPRVLLIAFGFEVFGCFGRGEEEWAYEHLGNGGQSSWGRVGYGEASWYEVSGGEEEEEGEERKWNRKNSCKEWIVEGRRREME